VADILLTHSNHLYSDRKQVRKMQPYPPLQTLMVAALLRERGYSIALCDVTLSVSADDAFEAALDEHRPRVVGVIEDNFNFLTKMCLTRNRELAFRTCAAARRAGVGAFVNGADATDRAAEYLSAGFDFVIAGEPEGALDDVLDGLGNALPDRRASRPDRGTTVRESVPRVLRAARVAIDSLPDAAWDLIDVDDYRQAWIAAHGYFSINLVSSRGCPYRCNWCAKPVFGAAYSFRSPGRLALEMARMKNELGAEHVWFADDIFALSPQWTRAFADAVEQAGARLPFKMQSRCDLMTRDTVSALKRAGCAEVWMGAESGSQKILDAMDKGTRVAQIYEARENLRRHGIRACYFLQFGYPGETWEDIQKTIRMVRETGPDDVGVSVSYPLPGTRFHARVAEEMGEKANWRDSDDVSMMFRGAYSTEFYRELANAVHAEVRGGYPQWDRVYSLERTSGKAMPVWTCC
jgi:anaerobic magnesium-protoporphyrin IX monomethyl ester cyclase